MNALADNIKEFLAGTKWKGFSYIEQLPPSGSNRAYFRIYFINHSVIATYNSNINENDTFFAFSRHLRKKNLPVPEILLCNEEKTIYLQEDLGKYSLLDILQQNDYSDYTFSLYKKSLSQLANLQINGHQDLDYNLCLTAKEFGKQAILSDLLYFKYYFLDTLQLAYDKQAMMDDFEALSVYLTKTEYKFFMFRDFQSRNIIIKNNEVFFIDFQGGMQGALQYDVASLLWQAKAQLSDEWKNSLLEYYMDEVDKLLSRPVDRNIFIGQYNGYVLIRLLQVLGAYGFRGLFERKAHFLTSIPLALKNLENFLQNQQTGIITPELSKMLEAITGQEIISRFQPLQADENTPLVVRVNSFSYKKIIPEDKTGNGGGFVFDCRGLLNPGRFTEFKTLTGKNKKVIDFLEQKTRMNEFLNSAFNLVDISVEDYIKRQFTDLIISFGCTGGQHRSVYAAEQTARHLKNKYNVKVEVEHLNEQNWLLQSENNKPDTL